MEAQAAGVALGCAMNINWDEVRRVANRPEYRNFPECLALVREAANELKIKSPLDSD